MYCECRLVIVWIVCTLVSVRAAMTGWNRHLYALSTPSSKSLIWFLTEQCGSSEGQLRLASTLMKSTSFCDDYGDGEQCEWCAAGKILLECGRNWEDLLDMIMQVIDKDRDHRISVHESESMGYPYYS